MSRVKLNGTNDAEPVRPSRRADAARLGGANQAAPPAGAGSPQESDSVNVSDQATTVGRLLAQVAQLPDVRQERVEPLRDLVQSGSYHPSAHEIADAILKDEG